MRYGIFSDTHANLPALNAVMRCFDQEKVDALICLGDTVGYGSQPNECADIVRKNAKHTILGNHDAAVAGRMDYSYYYDAAREALDYHRRILSDENMEWLRNLAYMEKDEGTHFCHGSPVDLEEFEYIFSVEQAMTCIPIWERLGQATFIGHSHLCKAFAISKERVFEVVTKQFEVREEYRYVISVGSVGQPRDHDPRASYTIYDSGRRSFEFKRVEYDIAEAAKRIYDIGQLSDSFGARLFAGV
ncbi:bis(5'nucleosyl)-tetraphosphatase, ApaH [Plesiocystis pacifica SIR-1]|uniref:Bis(5'nucleosyl)-tetraphosphatase, ApaH n=1 Tax=Plesiocystis pacifica SIR-1 TaxID=391625 RepID=A6G786_9BACT|nr:metallophosphoesterase family protein [Plesiocystis pacifica]EDM78220.1 bis(5'nucleosyl)-tetraphosphatase, ApaH [Plesiocystis pacifica SIR-1]